jgi:diguanylate cyclase (GGDEF)-like protein
MNLQKRKTKTNRGDSMLRKILAPFLAVMFFQALLVYGMFYLLGVTNELKQNSVDLLTEKTASRSAHFGSDMLQRWGSLGEEADMVTENLSALLRSRGKTLEDFNADPMLQERLLTSMASEIVYILRRNNVAGAFLTLDDGRAGASVKQGLYFRDSDLDSVRSNYADIVTVRAPRTIADNLGLDLDAAWTPGFAIGGEEDEKSLWYHKPFGAATASDAPAMSDLGYWSDAFAPIDGASDAVSFSEPLLYEGRPYGVIGVEINPKLMTALLLGAAPFMPETGYILSVTAPAKTPVSPDAADRIFSPVAADGLYANAVMDGEEGVRPTPAGKFPGLFRIDGVSDDTVYAVWRDIRVYGEDSPFRDRQWAILGVQSEAVLFGFANRVNALMLVMFFASLAVGAMGITIVAKVVAAPVEALTRLLRGKDPNAEITLDKTGIDEIDELSEAIEYLSGKVADANRKLADLLEMSQTSLAVFEYQDRSNNRIIYTRQFADLFGLPCTNRKSMGLRAFMRHMRKLHPAREPEYESKTDGNEYVFRVTGGRDVCRLRLIVTKDTVRRAGVITDITREIADRRRLEYDRDYDMLTDVFNRRAFHARMTACFNEPNAVGIAAVIMLDLDNLKNLNDTYGHDYGDKYIRLTADILKKFASDRTVVARLAGDEFIVFFHGFESKEQIRAVCDRIKFDMNRAFLNLPDGSGTAVRISAGIAWYPDDSDSAEELIRFADFAMYMVKKTNKGQFREFDLGVYNKHSYLLYNKSEFDDIIEHEKVQYKFQPIVEAATGDIFAYEALMRPMGENINNPADLISLAKAHSRLQQVECITFRKAMEAFVDLDAAKTTDCKIFINTIANQIMPGETEHLFEERFKDFLPRMVCEMTENEAAGDVAMSHKLARMKALGIEMAIDDFGAGYNSESTMLKYPPKYLKIDMTLIKDIHIDANRQALTKNLIEYSKNAGIRVLAEGIELRDEMEYLIGAGIDLMQGYYLCQPMSVPPLELPEIKSEIAAIRARREIQTTARMKNSG